MSSLAVLGFVLGGLAQAAQDQPAPPPATPVSAPQHVTVPSLPGTPNREGTIKPQSGMGMDQEGYAQVKPLSTNTDLPKPTPQPKAKKSAGQPSTAAGGAATAPAADLPVGVAPTGKAVTTGANYAHVNGVVTSISAGKSVTVKVKGTGANVTYTFASGAVVPADLKPGEAVRVRLQVAEKGKVADRVERATPK